MSDKNGQTHVPAIEAAEDRPSGTPNEPSLAVLVEELTATNDRLLRALAEQQNTNRRAQRDQEQELRHATANFAADLLTPLDNLDRAIESVPKEQRTMPAVAGLLNGVEATRRGLLDAFVKHGLERFDPLGEPFDPYRHEASHEATNSDSPPGTVVTVVRPGYSYRDRLLRPALVGVSKANEDHEEN